jgi:general secretion pathway protein K
MNNQRGIALFQVLLLSTILTVVILSMNYQAREHIKLAQAAQDYAGATLVLQSAEAELLFTMLTSSWYELERDDRTHGFNFYGKTFGFNGADVNIQDTSGLLNLISPDSNLMSSLTDLYTNDPQLGRDITAAISDWQDKDEVKKSNGAEQPDYPQNIIVRNGPIQYSEELRFIKGMTEELYQELSPMVSLFPRGLNLNQQPASIWNLYIREPSLSEVIKLREAHELTAQNFERLTGVGVDEFQSFSIGPGFRIRFTAFNSNVKLSKEMTVRLLPLRPEPIEFYEYRLRNIPQE